MQEPTITGIFFMEHSQQLKEDDLQQNDNRDVQTKIKTNPTGDTNILDKRKNEMRSPLSR